MRAADAAEVRAFGRSPKDALRLGLTTSLLVWTAKVDGRPEAMFGLSPVSAIGGEGAPWFLGTDEVYRHGRELVAWGPALIAAMRKTCPHLENWVAAGNVRAVRLLRRWGFSVGPDCRAFGDVEFYRFSM